MQNSNMLSWLAWVFCVMRPRIYSRRFRMAVEVEYLNNPLPDRCAPKRFLHGNALDVCGLDAVQTTNNVLQFFDIGQTVAFPKEKNKSSIASLRTCHCSSSSLLIFSLYRPSTRPNSRSQTASRGFRNQLGERR